MSWRTAVPTLGFQKYSSVSLTTTSIFAPLNAGEALLPTRREWTSAGCGLLMRSAANSSASLGFFPESLNQKPDFGATRPNLSVAPVEGNSPIAGCGDACGGTPRQTKIAAHPIIERKRIVNLRPETCNIGNLPYSQAGRKQVFRLPQSSGLQIVWQLGVSGRTNSAAI